MHNALVSDSVTALGKPSAQGVHESVDQSVPDDHFVHQAALEGFRLLVFGGGSGGFVLGHSGVSL